MNNRKPQNSIIALAIGLLLTVASSPLFAQTEKQSDISINKKPLSDFGRELKQKIDNKEIDLNSPFVFEISGVIDRNGKLDSKTTKVIRAESDQKITDTFKDAIMAFSETGFLQYFQDLGMSDFNILAKQDDSNISVAISSVVKKRERANSVVSGLNMVLTVASQIKSSEQDANELFLLRSMRARADNDKVIIEFAAPKNKVHEIISRELAKY